jgi:hypothetical protein
VTAGDDAADRPCRQGTDGDGHNDIRRDARDRHRRLRDPRAHAAAVNRRSARRVVREEPREQARRRGAGKARVQGRQIVCAAPEGVLERRARGAVAEVAAKGSRAKSSSVSVGEGAANDIAAEPAPGLGFMQREPRLVDRLPGGGRRDVEDVRNLDVGKAGELAQQERAPLSVWQRLEIRSEPGKAEARLDCLLEAGRRRRLILLQRDVRTAEAQHADRLVVRDSEQPGTRWRVRISPRQCIPCLDHRVL